MSHTPLHAGKQWGSVFAHHTSQEHLRALPGHAARALLTEHYAFHMRMHVEPDSNKAVDVMIHRDMNDVSHITADPDTRSAAHFRSHTHIYIHMPYVH